MEWPDWQKRHKIYAGIIMLMLIPVSMIVLRSKNETR